MIIDENVAHLFVRHIKSKFKKISFNSLRIMKNITIIDNSIFENHLNPIIMEKLVHRAACTFD
jgi:hypothetical protein